ncbi:MAG: hypothetical protein JSR17_11380 [Proteobacteria bacterium]|nr:hypothetical protein [Pseudomonadota bacterium]
MHDFIEEEVKYMDFADTLRYHFDTYLAYDENHFKRFIVANVKQYMGKS